MVGPATAVVVVAAAVEVGEATVVAARNSRRGLAAGAAGLRGRADRRCGRAEPDGDHDDHGGDLRSYQALEEQRARRARRHEEGERRGHAGDDLLLAGQLGRRRRAARLADERAELGQLRRDVLGGQLAVEQPIEERVVVGVEGGHDTGEIVASPHRVTAGTPPVPRRSEPPAARARGAGAPAPLPASAAVRVATSSTDRPPTMRSSTTSACSGVRSATECVDGLLRAEALDGQLRGVARARPTLDACGVDQLAVDRHEAGPAGGPAPVVGQPVAGDGEQPRPEVPLAAHEAVEPDGDGQPDLPGQVVRDAGLQPAQEARAAGAGRCGTAPGARRGRPLAPEPGWLPLPPAAEPKARLDRP